jgi:hypothetical protein
MAGAVAGALRAQSEPGSKRDAVADEAGMEGSAQFRPAIIAAALPGSRAGTVNATPASRSDEIRVNA